MSNVRIYYDSIIHEHSGQWDEEVYSRHRNIYSSEERAV